MAAALLSSRAASGVDVVVIDDGEGADALEPCVHDEMRGVLAAFGVGVVDMVVEHGLIPVLGHFQHVVAVQQPPYHGVAARGGLPEVVGEAKLRFEVSVRAHEFLHELHEHTPRVDAQRGARHDEHFVAQGGKGFESVVGMALGEGVEQAEHRRGHAHFRRHGQFQNAGRAELRHETRPVIPAFAHRSVDHGEKLIILGIERSERCVMAIPAACLGAVIHSSTTGSPAQAAGPADVSEGAENCSLIPWRMMPLQKKSRNYTDLLDIFFAG